MFERRVGIVVALGGAYLLLIVGRLFHMQVVDAAHWREEATNLSRRLIRLPARRGAIFDSKGRALAEDRLQMDLMVRLDVLDKHPWRCLGCGRPVHTTRDRPPSRCRVCRGREFSRNEPPGLPPDISALLPGVREEFRAAVQWEVDRRMEASGKARRDHVERQLRGWWWLVRAEVEPELVKEVSLNPERFRGFAIHPIYRRVWPGGDVVRFEVGVTTGVQGKEEFKAKREEGLSKAEIWRLQVGRRGLERYFEAELRARDGWRRVERDDRGRVTEILEEVPPRDGKPLTTCLDLQFQAAATEELRGACAAQGAVGGAFVALDPVSGEVSCVATWPPVRESGVHRSLTPMVPGSVFKAVTALAGLESGKLDPDQAFDCVGVWNKIGCHGVRHGLIDLEDALRVSCNGYFAHAAGEMGIAVLAKWARVLGFDEPTGIELPGDLGGQIPGDERMWPGEVYQVGFGQGALTVTPLQVARMMAIVGNGGRFVTPTLVLGKKASGKRVLSVPNVARVRRALRAVVERGTARGVGLSAHGAAGKTGTAELEGRKGNIAWFAGYAPAERPTVAYACYLEGARDSGGKAAGSAVAAILERILGK